MDLKSKFAFNKEFGLTRNEYKQELSLNYTPMDEEWKERNKDSMWWANDFRGYFIDKESYKIAYTINKLPLAQIFNFNSIFLLKKRILEFGGDDVCLDSYEEDIIPLLNRAQFWKASKDNVIKMEGVPNQCHKNSCELWYANNDTFDIHICTGYALSQDGLWRQHSWLVAIIENQPKIIETTVDWVAYYGFIRTEEECELFYNMNN